MGESAVPRSNRLGIWSAQWCETRIMTNPHVDCVRLDKPTDLKLLSFLK